MAEPVMSNIPPSQREDAKKTRDEPGKKSDAPGFGGPGASATAPEKPKPHSSRVMNKLDPRFDQDALDAQQRGEVNASGNSSSA